MRGLLGLVLLVALGAGGWIFNEARKEVKFLCGNFGLGVTQDSVLSQLGTGDFLRYEMVGGPDGTAVIVDSLYTLNTYRCTILLNHSGQVLHAEAGFHLPF
jgi:hypothetical protein